jgi:hypothetical protein
MLVRRAFPAFPGENPSFTFLRVQRGRPMSSDAFGKKSSYKCAIEADAAIHAAAQDR